MITVPVLIAFLKMLGTNLIFAMVYAAVMRVVSHFSGVDAKINYQLLILDNICISILLKIAEKLDQLWNYHGDLVQAVAIGLIFFVVLMPRSRWFKITDSKTVVGGR